jgi:hypothetical protein
MNDLKPPDVYFGRIDSGWNDETREHLWKTEAFGVMFDNDGSVDAADLARARSQQGAGAKDWWKAAGYGDRYGIEALERLQQAVDARALVFVDFRGRKGENRRDDTVMIGRATGPLHIVSIPETYTRGGRHEERVSRYKCITIAEPKFFPLDPVLAAMRPQQATFTRWPSAAKRVRALYEETPLARSVESLTPGQLEALCYEHLRISEPELRLLMPVGRTLPDVDIYGWLPDGTRIAAQVTHSVSNRTILIHKAEALAKTAAAEKRVLFAGGEAIAAASADVANLRPPVTLVAIESVFSEVDAATPRLISSDPERQEPSFRADIFAISP